MGRHPAGQAAAWTSLFQNYMGPLRLVLSPADMAAIFINLEVSIQPWLTHMGALQATAPRVLGELCLCQHHC